MTPGAPRRLVATATLIALLATSGCRRERPGPAAAPAPSAPSAPSATASARAPVPVTQAEPTRDPDRERTDPPESSDAGAVPWVLDDVGDCGPAAAARATARGVVMVERNDDVKLARLGKWPAGPKAAECPVAPVQGDAGSFVPLARAPAADADHAYWISRGRLVRRAVTAEKIGPLEILAHDARDGSAAVTPESRPEGAPRLAAYLARGATDDAPLRARLWVEGGGTFDLTPEGSAANTVALAATGGDLVAVSLEGRSGMSPVHARRITFDGSTVVLGEDTVVWLGGAAQALTQLSAVGTEGGLTALVALERDITRFGLARIPLSSPPRMGADVAWRDYPNGLDPAPVDSATLCGKPAVLYARPAEARPRSPQELHLAPLEAGGLGASVVVARARAFSTATLSAAPGGALLAYVADWRTWTRTVRCR